MTHGILNERAVLFFDDFGRFFLLNVKIVVFLHFRREVS